MNHLKTLEFDQILSRLSDYALSSAAKERCLSLVPTKNIGEAKQRIHETTQAKKIIEQTGSPPVAIMDSLEKAISLAQAEAILTPSEIGQVGAFLMTCRRMKDYLKRAESIETDIAFYGNAMIELSALEDELNRCLRNDHVEDRATSRLHDLRRSIQHKGEHIKSRLESLLQKNKQYCAEDFASLRSGRYTLPVKKEYRNKIQGTLIALSNTGGTCFIEPSAVGKLQDELNVLRVEEENEIRSILYTLTALIMDDLASIKVNMEAMETLDFLFAKAKLSMDMKASPIRLTDIREVRLLSARHPLLCRERAVPLDFALGGSTSGVVVTGPNTGGKTVAIKTVGLLSLMAQSGLHVPADESSSICVFDIVLCDIGDGQSISENLSTFSSHMANIIDILSKTSQHSLVLLDELGSGTDPAEGMGIAMAILAELLVKGCLFTVTTHYPEIKDFAATTPKLTNARMAFDKENLMPLYKLEIGEAGESCALHIAERLGMAAHILKLAREITYSGSAPFKAASKEENPILTVTSLDIADESPKPTSLPRSQRFHIGDSVIIYPQKEIGIVYACANEKGEIGVQIRGKKSLLNHKRMKLKVAASELYPDEYDFSIIFDSVENRKARHLMGRKHVEGNKIVME